MTNKSEVSTTIAATARPGRRLWRSTLAAPSTMLATFLNMVRAARARRGSSMNQAVVTPCENADCDGHGWINGTSPRGYQWAKPCPSCPAQVRRSLPIHP